MHKLLKKGENWILDKLVILDENVLSDIFMNIISTTPGLEIPDRPVANAMRNGEGLQLIPNTVARLAIIFFTTWYVKIACFHNIKRCWKWPASHRLHASWFSLCVAWMNGFRAQGTGLRYYGMCKYRACDWPAWDARLLSVFFGYKARSDN